MFCCGLISSAVQQRTAMCLDADTSREGFGKAVYK